MLSLDLIKTLEGIMLRIEDLVALDEGVVVLEPPAPDFSGVENEERVEEEEEELILLGVRHKTTLLSLYPFLMVLMIL